MVIFILRYYFTTTRIIINIIIQIFIIIFILSLLFIFYSFH